MQWITGVIACACFGAGLCGAGAHYVLYALIFSFYTVFGFEEV